VANQGPEPSTLHGIRELRRTIDGIDEKILDLVNRRLSAAVQIGRIKQEKGEPVIDEARENDIFNRLDLKNPGPLSGSDLRLVFSTIIAASREIQTRGKEIHGSGSIRMPATPFLDAPDRLNARTVLFGLFGDPVSHSLSPVMHNRAMQVMGINGIYLAFGVKRLENAVEGLRALNMKGASVTIPYKTAVMPYLDDIDELAERIGAVNTICNDRGRLVGYNTDCEAALNVLSEKADINGKKIAIIGAGGAAQAIGYGIVQAGGRTIIYNRSKERGAALAARLGTESRPLDEFGKKDYDILINATPVGMWPDVERMPVPDSAIRAGAVVMDTVYNPVRTRLLKAAESHRAIPIDGVAMFVRQGARQFKLWTGMDAPVAEMRSMVLNALCPNCA